MNRVQIPEIYGSLCRQHNITVHESMEIFNYMRDFKENFFQNLNELNNYITKNEEWEYYPTIRSLNTHGIHKDIPGIQPEYYKIVCRELKINGGTGKPLDNYKAY